MPMVRKNPLPPGRYWIFIQKASLDIFEQWIRSPSVTVEKREDSGGFWPFISPNESWFLFEISLPTPWPRGVGFPNAADPSTHQATDVVDRPPPVTAKQIAKDIVETASEAAKGAMTGTAIVAIIVILMMRRN